METGTPAEAAGSPFARTLDMLRSDPGSKLFWDIVWRAPVTESEFREYARELYSFAQRTGGLLGRSPDFLAGIVTAWAHNAEHFGAAASRVRDFHRQCQASNSILTHAISDISERGRPAPDTLLRVVARDSGGVYLRGFKQLATLAPYADHLLVYPYRILEPADADTALCFAVEPGSAGVTIHTRAGFALAHQDPDASIDALDEQDAIVEFRDTYVPDAHVFIDGSADRCNRLREGTGMTHPAWLQALARMAAKARTLHALAERILAGGAGSAKEPGVVLATLDRFAATTERDFELAVESATFLPHYGFWAADRRILLQGIGNFTERIEGATLTLSRIAGLDLICPRPGRTDLAGSIPAAPQVSDWTLFTNLCAGAYGYRQTRYELAFVGDADRLAAGLPR